MSCERNVCESRNTQNDQLEGKSMKAKMLKIDSQTEHLSKQDRSNRSTTRNVKEEEDMKDHARSENARTLDG